MSGCGYANDDSSGDIAEQVDKYLEKMGKGRNCIHVNLPDHAINQAKIPDEIKQYADVRQHFLQIDHLNQPTILGLGYDYNAVVYDKGTMDIVATIMLGNFNIPPTQDVVSRWLAIYGLSGTSLKSLPATDD